MNKKSMLLFGAMMLAATPLYAQEANTPANPPVQDVPPVAAPADVDAKDMVPPPPPPAADELADKIKARGEKIHKPHNGFAEKLNLTDEQKEKAKLIHEKGMQEMKAVFEEMKALRKKAEDLRKANMDEFKSILTEEQLKVFESLPKPEQKRGFHDKKYKKDRKDRKDKKDSKSE